MKKKFLGWTAILLFVFACNLPGNTQTPVFDSTPVQATQAAASPVPQTEVQPTQAEQLTPDGEVVTAGGVTFMIPNGMAMNATATSTTEVELPYINPGGGDMPLHTKFTLNSYTIQEATTVTPTLIVFKADEYSQYSELTTSIVSDLFNLQFTDGQPVPDSLANRTFMAQVHGVNFQNGKGIRYLTQIMQAPLPINNKDLYYFYQGITNDGQYVVEVILPVHAPFLSADDNPNTPLPADGIPFNMDNVTGYMDAVTQKLNTTDTFSFTPYLDHIDALIESLQIKGL